MSEVVTSFALERLASVLPRFLALRIAPLHVVKSELRVDLRRQNPIALDIGRTVPLMRLWFTINNRSQIAATFDRATVEVWLGQPMLYGAIIKRANVKSRAEYDDLLFEAVLTTEQAAEIRARQQDPPQHRPQMRVQLRSWFETRVGWVEVVDTAERDLPA